MADPITGQSTDPNVPGITGENTAGQNSVGVKGIVRELGWGVLGESNSGTGVVGISQSSFAIFAKSDKGAAILAQSNTADGVFGRSQTARGVIGISDSQTGVEGSSTSGVGVFGSSNTGEGVHGVSHSGAAAVIGINDQSGPGVRGVSSGFDGVSGTSLSPQHAGVAGGNDKGGIGVFGKGNPAGFFAGDVIVEGTLSISPGVLKIRGFSLGPEQIQALTTLQQLVNDLKGQLAYRCLFDEKVRRTI